MRRVTLITTGGTIEKTYDVATGNLANRGSIVRRMLRRLRLEDAQVGVVELMSKDSLELTDADRTQILGAVRNATSRLDTGGVVILHGTDTLCITGEMLASQLGAALRTPVVLTGAMHPFEMKKSDALQNLTEAIFAAGVLDPGVYCVAHGRTLRFPGVRKDRSRWTFVRE